MTTSPESKPERTDLSTQKLPDIPTVQEMETWDTEKVLRWIHQRDSEILEDDDRDNLKKARIRGRNFLHLNVKSFQSCNLPLGVAVDLNNLADQVRGKGKFIPRT
jgi:hypothetical protein